MRLMLLLSLVLGFCLLLLLRARLRIHDLWDPRPHHFQTVEAATSQVHVPPQALLRTELLTSPPRSQRGGGCAPVPQWMLSICWQVLLFKLYK